MKLVTWNMGCGSARTGYRKHHDEAWAYLIEQLQPDVALVQEAVVKKLMGAERDYTVAVCDLAPRIDAGAAVLVRRAFPAEPVLAPLKAQETYIAAARVTIPTGSFVAASIHVYPGKFYKEALLSLSGNLGPAFADEPAVVAGDFNAARHYDEVYGRKLCGGFFEAMEAAGFHEAHWKLHGKEAQSFWGRQAKEKYQDDHFFVTGGWAARVKSCTVVDNEVVRRVSDHGPVVLELDVS